MYYSEYLNRTLCDVLAEMRKCHETRNYSYLLALIEEAQSMGNKMEAGLGDKKDLEYRQAKVITIKKEIKKLEKKRDKLKRKVKC